MVDKIFVEEIFCRTGIAIFDQFLIESLYYVLVFLLLFHRAVILAFYRSCPGEYAEMNPGIFNLYPMMRSNDE